MHSWHTTVVYFNGSIPTTGRVEHRVTQQVSNMGCVDFDFRCYTVCLILYGQNGQNTSARWHIQFKVNPTQVRHLLCHPVVRLVVSEQVRSTETEFEWRLKSIVKCSGRPRLRFRKRPRPSLSHFYFFVRPRPSTKFIRTTFLARRRGYIFPDQE